MVKGNLLLEFELLGHSLVEIINHALEQMKVRDLTEDDVFLTLIEPDEVNLPTQPGQKRVRRNISRREGVDVVYEEIYDRIRIITAIAIEKKRRLAERGNP